MDGKTVGKTIGYIRTSTVGQSTVRQLDGVALDKTFIDQCSGSSTDRPALTAMLEYVREGDIVVVHSIDRLARNTQDLLKLVDTLTGKGITIRFSKENLSFGSDNNDKLSKLMLEVLGAVASFELAMINERRAEGQAIAKAAGKHIGRKPSLSDARVLELKARAYTGANKTLLAEEFGVSRAALYNYLKLAV